MFVRASVRIAYSGSAAATPSPRRWPGVNRQKPSWVPICGPFLVDDRAGSPREALPPEERAVVVAGEEARLLALGALRGRETGDGRLLAGLLLRLLAEREPDAVEEARIESRQHVALILDGVGGAGEQQPPLVLDDAGVVAGRELRRADALREREQLREPEPAVAARCTGSASRLGRSRARTA